MPLGCQRTGVGSVQTKASEVVDHAEERGVGGLLGRPEFEGEGGIYLCAYKVLSALSQCFRNSKRAYNEVLNIASIEEDPTYVDAYGSWGLRNGTTDDDFGYGDEGPASPKPPPSRAITPSGASIKSPETTPTAATMKRRVIRVSDMLYPMYRATSCFLYAG